MRLFGWQWLKHLAARHARHTTKSMERQSMYGNWTVSPAVKARRGSNGTAP